MQVTEEQKGIYVSYKKKDGTIQHGIMLHVDQRQSFRAVNKIAIRKTDSNFNIEKKEDGKERLIVVLKYERECTKHGNMN